MFEENSIVRCITNTLNKFTKGNAYRIISKDFEHSKGYFYGVVNDAGLIDYFCQEKFEENFTDKDVPNEITYHSNTTSTHHSRNTLFIYIGYFPKYRIPISFLIIFSKIPNLLISQ